MIHKWKQLSQEDISPGPWFPLVRRSYQLPNGAIVDDFTITTMADVAMVVPVTEDGKIVLVRQYKPGVDEITLEFPAGRAEPNHKDMLDTARHELLEETGMEAEELLYYTVLSGFPTKATEKVYCYVGRHAKVVADQHLDATEEIELVYFTPEEFDQAIANDEILCSSTIAAWIQAKNHFPEIFV